MSDQESCSLAVNELFVKRRAEMDLENEKDIEVLRAKALNLLGYFFDEKVRTKIAFRAGMQMGSSHNPMMARQFNHHNGGEF